MTSSSEALQRAVESANNSMAEIARDSCLSSHDQTEKLRAIREPIIDALRGFIPEEFERNWPEQWRDARICGPNFVGLTSDTHRIVCLGADRGIWREFQII